jgi:uncharacterized membrane protein YidH (DUF202 family)
VDVVRRHERNGTASIAGWSGHRLDGFDLGASAREHAEFVRKADAAKRLHFAKREARRRIGPARARKPAEGLMKLIGICLIVFGVLALALGGFNYTTRERVVDLGPLKVDADKNHSVPIAPIAGVAALVGGVALVLVGSKSGIKG